MTREIATFDLDDVLVDTASWIVDAYNAEHGTQLTLRDWYATHSTAWGPIDEAEAVRRVNMLVQSEEFLGLEPSEEAQIALASLAQRYDLHVLTGRSDAIAAQTSLALDRHFPGIFRAVHFSNMFNPDKVRSKGEMCLEIGSTRHTDDHLGHARSVAAMQVPAIVFGSYPWNQTTDVLPEGIIRCLNWEAVVRQFDDPLPIAPVPGQGGQRPDVRSRS